MKVTIGDVLESTSYKTILTACYMVSCLSYSHNYYKTFGIVSSSHARCTSLYADTHIERKNVGMARVKSHVIRLQNSARTPIHNWKAARQLMEEKALVSSVCSTTISYVHTMIIKPKSPFWRWI